MEFNKIYKRTALPYLTYANQLDKDLKEICGDFPELSYESSQKATAESESSPFPIVDETSLWVCKIYLDSEKKHYVTFEKKADSALSGVKMIFYTPEKTVEVCDSGGSPNVSIKDKSYSIFKTQYGFGISFFDAAESYDPPLSTYAIVNYFFKMKNPEDQKEYFCCYGNYDSQTPAGANTPYVNRGGYLIKAFNNNIENISVSQFSFTGGTDYGSGNPDRKTKYGPVNVFANMYSIQDGSYAEHCYIKLCTEEGLLGHFTMGGKEFISGSYLALEC